MFAQEMYQEVRCRPVLPPKQEWQVVCGARHANMVIIPEPAVTSETTLVPSPGRRRNDNKHT
jgi:hypothetical protein